MQWSALNLIPFERTLITWKRLGFQTIVGIIFPNELCAVLSRGLFCQVAARRTCDLYSDKTKIYQGLWHHGSACPVGSLIQIEMLRKVRCDLTFGRPAADEGPIGDDESGTTTTMFNADGLWFLVGEWVALIGVLTTIVVRRRRAR
jgi:hypothetical protein